MPDRTAFDKSHESNTLSEPRPKYRMTQICLGFFFRGNSEFDRDLTVSKTVNLRKDKLHPVSPFTALPQLCENLREETTLGIHKALKIERIFRHNSGQRAAVRADVGKLRTNYMIPTVTAHTL